ncbi:uncharacterized protein LOC110688408 isoform X2 [Chenopodium quinoa]|nr:uncharacterized protein LOC110688408 isoform X2 [Chenopodium quinoa]XP_021720841.1 uncharacterized protein LOC110688408 isoform X2 [Chenopodium quinoa]
MVGSRGKGSRSKTKGLAPGPVEPEPLKISLDETFDGPLGGEDEKIDTLNTIVMPLEEQQIDEMISGSVFSDWLEEKDQNVHEVNVATEISFDRTEDVCTQEGTIKDVDEVINGSDAAADDVEDNEEKRINPKEDETGKSDKKPEEDESKSLEVTREGVPTDAEGLSSFDHGTKETMVDNLEEPNKLDTEMPIGTLSDKWEEEHVEENASTANEVKEVTGMVIRPNRKVGKKKVVRRKVMVRRPVTDEAQKNDEKPEEDEAPVKIGPDSNDTDTGDERKSLKVTEGVPTDTEDLSSFDHVIQKTMIDSLENLEEPVKPDAEKLVGTLSDKGEEENTEENASITHDFKEVTVQVNRPKRKVVKKKLVKKKRLWKQAAAVNEEMPQPLDENNASGEACKVDMEEHVNIVAPSDEACKADANDHVNNAEGTEVKPAVKTNRKRNNIRRKKAPLSNSGIATVKDAHKLRSENNEQKIEKNNEINEPDVKNGEMEKSADRVSLSKRSKKKNAAKNGCQDGVSNDASKPKPSKEGKLSKKMDSMGMIFMCSSETKKDCYRYKILGLPAGKKDMVMKIYKGMRLFLFDVDLRMMYGVYKAADPGGYNIEPRAFKSQFPSQVRFSILEDCVPLAEERFKQVLKDNYYTKNKFNCQLNSKQVKDLCKLFHETNKKAESQKVSASRRPVATSSSARRDKKRKRVEDSRRGAAAPVERNRSRRRVQEEIRRAPVVIDDRSRRRAHEEIIRHAPVVIDDRSWRRTREEARHAPVVIDDRSGRRAQEEIRHAHVALDDRYQRHPVYERETYLSSLPPATSYQPLPALSPPGSRMYSFDRTLGTDSYRRESVLGHRDLGLSSSQESRLLVGRSHHDLNLSYREPHVYSAPLYSTDTRREHYDYTSDRLPAEYYTPAEHRPPPPLYRRY